MKVQLPTTITLNTFITPVVYRRHTLGYLFKTEHGFSMSVLASNVIKEAPNYKFNDLPLFDFEVSNLELATKGDFNQFGVSPSDCNSRLT